MYIIRFFKCDPLGWIIKHILVIYGTCTQKGKRVTLWVACAMYNHGISQQGLSHWDNLEEVCSFEIPLPIT